MADECTRARFVLAASSLDCPFDGERKRGRETERGRPLSEKPFGTIPPTTTAAASHLLIKLTRVPLSAKRVCV